MRRTTLLVVVEYDDAITDPDVIASYLDLVLDAAHSSLDQCGPLTFSEVRIDHESDEHERTIAEHLVDLVLDDGGC